MGFDQREVSVVSLSLSLERRVILLQSYPDYMILHSAEP